MKFSVKIALALFIGFCGCSYAPEPEYYKLRVEYDNTFDWSSYSDAGLYAGEDSVVISPKYDTATKGLFYDSLIPGRYRYDIYSVFTVTQRNSFDLDKDTTIHITNTFGFTYTKLIDSATLASVDTIEIAFTSNGCFHGYYERMVLTKNRAVYNVTTGRGFSQSDMTLPAVNGKVPPTVLNGIVELQTKLSDHQDSLDRLGIVMSCTTRSSLYVKAGSSIFQFHDVCLLDWTALMNSFSIYFDRADAAYLM